MDPEKFTAGVAVIGMLFGLANFVMLLVVKNAVLGSEIRIKAWTEQNFVRRREFDMFRRTGYCSREDCDERLGEGATGD